MSTIPALLRARADSEDPFLRFAERELSFAAAHEEALALAGGLRGLGVQRGDLVALLLPNRPEFVLTWFALNLLGAAQAPVNTAFRGPGLSHALNVTRARVLVLDEELLEPLAAVASELDAVTDVVAVGDRDRIAAELPRGWRVHAFAEHAGAGPARPLPSVEPSDLAMVLFTSGTTGRSKGCMLSHRYAVRQAQIFSEQLELRGDDVLYSPFALFHIDAAVFTVMPALHLGAVAALGRRFSASRFWDEVREFGATVFDFMGATLTMLYKRPPDPRDADNPVRLAWGVPMPAWAEDFERRFGLRLTELYGLTDAGVVIYSPAGEPRWPGACGRAVDPFEVTLGEGGEILIRSREPGLLMDGYFGMPEATREAFRDGWFHTGDIARQDAEGFFYFVGRRKEMIRRRGENISAFEVEEVVGSHPDVLEVAAYGVPSPLLEEEVMVAVVPRPGRSLDPAALVEHCRPLMARHMLPRYVEVMEALPRTPTEKVEKYRLAERGVTAATWDREAVGACR